ncbi:MAG: glutathione S-transferase [Rhodobacteraceae bacterium]|nr:glutathione S-transferase [Paracoccaceae bacterium]
MYELHGSPRSRAFRALWMMEELGVPYEHHNTGPRTPEILALNPLGKVPAMKVGDDVLTDSTAILTYLADKHGALTYPAGTIERAKQDAHTNFLLDEVDSLLWIVSRHTFGLPEELRVPEIKASAREEFHISAERLANRIEGPFLMGKKMTIPDIIAVHCLGWALVAKFPMERQDLKDYSKPIRARDAYKRAQALG